MVSLRLRYENGYFIPLDPLPDLQEGMEIEAKWEPSSEPDAIDEMLDRTAGLWAELDFDMEGFLEDTRARWDEDLLSFP
jgi:predicted DNA-binding antitoxin AbrB/MazE fold protein